MIVMKIIGAVLIITSTSAMGFYLSNNLKIRIDDMKELKKNILILRGDIRFGNTPLPEAIGAIARRNEGNLAEFFTYVYEEVIKLDGKRFFDIWKVAVKEKLKDSSLTKNDKEHLIKLGENLGYLDKDMQINLIDLYIEQLEEEMTEASKVLKEKAHLYNTLGVMAGIFVTIIML